MKRQIGTVGELKAMLDKFDDDLLVILDSNEKSYQGGKQKPIVEMVITAHEMELGSDGNTINPEFTTRYGNGSTPNAVEIVTMGAWGDLKTDEPIDSREAKKSKKTKT